MPLTATPELWKALCAGSNDGVRRVRPSVYLTSFIHRETLFEITQRWLCGRLEPDDARRITEILICDGFVLGEVLGDVAKSLLGMVHQGSLHARNIRLKGEMRDAICQTGCGGVPRVSQLIRRYREKPDFFYREAPINGVMYLNHGQRLVGLHRVKRPRRIAEKANRYLANWIFGMVQDRARGLATARARAFGIPVEDLLTSAEDMAREFIQAEEAITEGFRQGAIGLDRTALTIHDVGGVKVVAEPEGLHALEERLSAHPIYGVRGRESHRGDYQATSLILEVPWDRQSVCRKFTACRCWERYRNRGIPDEDLDRGLEPLLGDAAPTVNIEVILSTFADMVESELGNSIHEERILSQRDTRVYRGYIPTNVEFLVEYLFAVGFSPTAQVDELPIKLWGRYLPDTVISQIRHLHGVPESEILC